MAEILRCNNKILKYNGKILTILGSDSNCLCFTANTAGSTVELYTVGNPLISDTAYSTDGSTWITFTPSISGGIVITLANVGDKVYFRNNINGDFSTSNYLMFNMTGSIAASGNINSMYSATDYKNLKTLSYKYCYYSMFWYCTSLTTTPELPATVLSEGCYDAMFYNCTSLTTPPALPATTLASYCYADMFNGCTSLKTVPLLPATTLVDDCYNMMFYNCTSLYVSDTALKLLTPYAWIIPGSVTLTFTNTTTYNQPYMFKNCLGTRSSDTMTGAYGENHTYYVYNIVS